MKILAFSFRKEERYIFDNKNKELGFLIDYIEEPLTLENVDRTKGYDGIIVLTNCKVNLEIAKKLHDNRVKYIASRAAGTDHLDLKAIKEYGMKVANVPSYSPSAISEHTVLLILSIVRNLKKTIQKVEDLDFGIEGLRGREIGSLKIGVVGTGRIGFETIKILHGFGSQVVAFDMYENPAVKQYATYITEEELYNSADVIVYHCPLTEENYHVLDDKKLRSCKDGVVIINTARGGLMDIEAIRRGLESGKIGGFAFDVYENEAEYLRKKITDDSFGLMDLIHMPNVIYTPHVSFFTDKSIYNMIETSLDNLKEFLDKDICTNQL